MGWPRSTRRAGRLTNLALLVVLTGAFLTGWLVFAAGRPVSATSATIAHGGFGLALLALVPWKSMIINRSRRRRPAGLALATLVIICLVAGLVQLFGGFGYRLGVSPIQVHVGAALVIAPLLVWHVLRHRRQRVRRSDLSRRNLLRSGAVALGAGAGFVGLAGMAEWSRGADRRRTNTGSRPVAPQAIPATIWLLDDVPQLDPATHRVMVAGTGFSAAEIEAKAGPPIAARLDCTSGWYADATWTATRLSDLIPPETLGAATSLVVRSATGYARRFSTTEAAGLWLATRCEGRPLTSGTGAPVRLVAPGRRGFWWVKWVAAVELSDRPSWAQLPFPAT